MDKTLLEAALEYARMGWYVFPLCWPDENGRCACGWNHAPRDAGKAPRTKRGRLDATTSEEHIRAWWTLMPQANIGCNCELSRLVILDADSPEAEKEIEENGLPEGTPVYASVRGKKYILRLPEGVPFTQRSHRGKSGDIDIPSYAVLPPSKHRSGVNYAWIKPPQGPVPEAPEWVIKLMQEHPTATVGALDLGDPPSYEEAASAARAVQSLIPVRARRIWQGEIPTNDRSGQAYELARLAVEAGIKDPWAVACLVYSSAPHRDKFSTRRDAWLDACRVSERALKGKPAPEEEKAIIIPLSQIKPEPVTFVVAPYIPRGELTFIEGDPGSGKSWFWMALVAGLTGSETHPVPWDQSARRDCRVLILTTEDSLPKTVVQRLTSLGANMDLIGVVKVPGVQEGLVTTANFRKAEEAIYEYRPDLMVVDTLTLYASADLRIDIHVATHMRSLLEPLKAISRELDAGTIIIRHFVKTPGKAIYRGLGSIDAAGTVRSILSVGIDKTTGVHIVTHTKTNLSAQGPALKFVLNPNMNPPFQWAGVEMGIDPDDITESEEERERRLEKRLAIEEAKEFLLELFAEGKPISALDGEKEARRRGISLRTLRRAREILGIKSKKLPGNNKFYWFPPEQYEQ